MNLADAVTYHARTRPNAVALLQYRGPLLRYAELDAAIRGTAAALLRGGIEPCQLVGVAMRTEPLHLVVLLALARIGAVSLPVHPGMPETHRRAVVRKYKPVAIVSDPKAPPLEGSARIVADPGWLEPLREAAGPNASGFNGDGVWRVALSSGTTGAPKGAALTHARMLEQMLLHRSVIPIDGNSRYLASADMNITFGLIPCLRHLFAGSAVVFPTTPRPVYFAEAVDRFAVTHMVTSPVALSGMFATARGQAERFPSLQHIAVLGGQMSQALVRGALQRISRRLWAIYGASEVGVLAMADLPTLLRHPGAVGHAVPWVEAQAVDDKDAVLPPGTSGVLRFRGLGFSSERYYEDPEASAKAFRDGWFYPGDTGAIAADGLLTLDGRIDDLINLSGNKVQPEIVERALQGHPEVLEAAVFGAKAGAGRPALYAALVTRGKASDDSLAELCRRTLSKVQTPEQFFRVSELPRNEAGKVLRGELAEWLKSGKLAS